MKKKNKVENKKVLKTKKSLKQKNQIFTFSCSDFNICTIKICPKTTYVKLKK